jgi:hypothetical protein
VCVKEKKIVLEAAFRHSFELEGIFILHIINGILTSSGGHGAKSDLRRVRVLPPAR